MDNAEIVKNFLIKNKGAKFCDDCLAKELKIKPRQQVNQITRPLKETSNFDRERGKCSICGKDKKVTWAK